MPVKEENKSDRLSNTDPNIRALDLIDKEKTHVGSGVAFKWWFIFYVGFIVYGIIQQTIWNFMYGKVDKDPTIIPADLEWFIWIGLAVYNFMYLTKHNTGSLVAIGEFAERLGNIVAKLKPKLKLNKPTK